MWEEGSSSPGMRDAGVMAQRNGQLGAVPRDQKGLLVGAQRSPLSTSQAGSLLGCQGGVLHSLFPAGCNTSHSPSRTSCSYNLFCTLWRDLVTRAPPPRP